jgi:hypothetical protein
MDEPQQATIARDEFFATRRLLAATLRRACDDIAAASSNQKWMIPRGDDGHDLTDIERRQLFDEVHRWFFSPRDDDDDGTSITFAMCCAGLGLCPSIILAKLRPFCGTDLKIRRRRLTTAAKLDILRCLENGSATTRELGLRHHVDSSTCRKVRLQWLAELEGKQNCRKKRVLTRSA